MVTCPACGDICNATGATTCGWCGFSPLPLTPGPYYGPAMPVTTTAVSRFRPTTIHAQVKTVHPLGASKAPGDGDLALLVGAMALGAFPLYLAGSATTVCCLGVPWVILCVAAFAAIQRNFRREKRLAEFDAETVDGRPVTLHMVNPTSAISVGDRLIATGTQLGTNVFYSSRVVKRSNGIGSSMTSLGNVVVKGIRRISPLYIGLAFAASLVFWLVVVPLLLHSTAPAR